MKSLREIADKMYAEYLAKKAFSNKVSNNIKSCPFCGSEASYEPLEGIGHRVICNKCEVHTCWHETKQESIDVWNNRFSNIDCNLAEKTIHGCLGYALSEYDDEPVDQCKKCDKYESYEDFKEEL